MSSTSEPATPVPVPAVKRVPQWRRVLRAALLALAALLTAYTLAAQFLAIVPVAWTMPLLQWAPLQTVIIVLDLIRDVLGFWNIVIALAAVAIFVLLRSPRRGRALTGISTSVLGAVGAVTSTTLLLVAVAPAGVGAFPLGNPLQSFVTTPGETVKFGTADGVEMKGDLYTPEGTAPDGGWPVVVSVHGGGFIQGTRQPNVFTNYLPQHGYAVLDVDWRPATSTFHAWNTQVGDVGCALGWLGTEGTEHGVDVDRIATLGGSSGGNLAINSAYMANTGTLVSSCDSTTTIPEVKAVVAGYPAVNLTDIADTSALARQVAAYYVGGQPSEYPERYEYTDSASHISKTSPPTFVYTGTRDHLVLASATVPFINALEQGGVVHKFVEYPGMGHTAGETSGSNYATEATLKTTLDWLNTYNK
ncbi:alpha/beta hydrolase family protein [Rhodococcus qingshengii]|uniref:alpha/beta hydrolase family protein n=1 Tax=Rhodococcus qingshengii TaxID=334542 RepID=UPI001BE8E0CD|nr:alpha/beta hydrolase [Rhodococcus qingshengii]MBT2273591.1 alpha/beta hydrolase [Rhodococcus qingshengii]